MVTASIVTYNTDPDELKACLDCLVSSEVSRIYIVDNSANKATEALCGEYTEVEYISSENKGYGAGHNIALRNAIDYGSKYHLVVNSDVSFDSQAISSLAEFMDDREEAGMVQPRILNADGSDQYTVRLLPSPTDMLLRLLPYKLRRSRTKRYELRDLDHEKIWNVAYHQGSFMFIRVEPLKQIGLFDERYFMYPEDIDLTRRMHEKYATLYYPGVSVIHYHRAESKHNVRMMAIHIANMIRYFNKWGWWCDNKRKEINKKVMEQKFSNGYCNIKN